MISFGREWILKITFITFILFCARVWVCDGVWWCVCVCRSQRSYFFSSTIYMYVCMYVLGIKFRAVVLTACIFTPWATAVPIFKLIVKNLEANFRLWPRTYGMCDRSPCFERAISQPYRGDRKEKGDDGLGKNPILGFLLTGEALRCRAGCVKLRLINLLN